MCRFPSSRPVPVAGRCSGPISSGSGNPCFATIWTAAHKALTRCDILLVIGTSGIVYPAAGFASVAKEAGAFVVEINLDPTPQSALVDISLQGRAKDLVPLLLEPL